MGFADDRNDERRRGPAPPSGGAGEPPRSRRRRPASPELGQALRAAYQRTIDEQIPPEMLDLLGKLG